MKKEQSSGKGSGYQTSPFRSQSHRSSNLKTKIKGSAQNKEGGGKFIVYFSDSWGFFGAVYFVSCRSIRSGETTSKEVQFFGRIQM